MAFKDLTRIFKKSSDKTGSILSSPTVSSAQPSLTSSTFNYDPLDTKVDSIRILILHRPDDNPEKEIRCSLIHTTFAEKPAYEALSYTWGEPQTSQHILLNGSKFAIRENLYWALRSLRSLNKDRLLWIDALCIDQSNFAERTYQVGLMDYIYTRASCVLVWLGRLPSAQLMTSMQTRIKYDSSTEENHSKDDPTEVYHYEDPLDSWICSREYWSRVWIIQEIGLARKLQVWIAGSTSQDWDKFILRLPSSGCPQQVSLIQALYDRRKRRNEPSNQLHELLEAFQSAKCTEPRDKIYGFLGLAHDCQNGSLKADYAASLFDLYTRTMGFFYRKQLDPGNSINKLETCLRTVGFSQLVLKLLGTPSPPNSLGLFASQPPPDQTSYALAAVAGRVLHVGPTYNMLYASSSVFKQWKIEFEKHGFSPKKVSELREANEAFDAFLSKAQNCDGVKVYPINPRMLWSRGNKTNIAWSNSLDNWSKDDPPWSKEIPLADANDTSLDISNDFIDDTGPRMFLASGCLMGLTPPETQPGDVICQFWNTDVVALLRPEAPTPVSPDPPPRLIEPEQEPPKPDSQNEIYRVIGRVYLSTGYLKDLEPMYRPWNIPVEGAETMLIGMDFGTLSELTS